MNKKDTNQDLQSTMLRSVRVLFGLGESGRPMSVTQLASALSLPASTTHRILNALRKASYVAQNEATGTYQPGMAFLRMSAMMAASSTFPSAVQSMLTNLVERSDESAFYAVYLNETQRMRFSVTLHSHHAIQYVMRGNQTHSLLWGASGYSMASRLPEQVLREIYEREKNSAEGVAKVPSWPALYKSMAQVRQDGYAISSGQRHDGSHAIAAPVVGDDEALIGCVGIALPVSRQQAEKTQKCVALVASAAAQLSLAARSVHLSVPLSS